MFHSLLEPWTITLLLHRDSQKTILCSFDDKIDDSDIYERPLYPAISFRSKDVVIKLLK